VRKEKMSASGVMEKIPTAIFGRIGKTDLTSLALPFHALLSSAAP
jgi:hypothetical protein